MPVLEQLLTVKDPQIHVGVDFQNEQTVAEGEAELSLRLGTRIAGSRRNCRSGPALVYQHAASGAPQETGNRETCSIKKGRRIWTIHLLRSLSSMI